MSLLLLPCLGDLLQWRERGILVTYYPLLAAASLKEGGKVLKLKFEKNLEVVSIRGHVVSVIDQCVENTPLN